MNLKFPNAIAINFGILLRELITIRRTWIQDLLRTDFPHFSELIFSFMGCLVTQNAWRPRFRYNIRFSPSTSIGRHIQCRSSSSWSTFSIGFSQHHLTLTFNGVGHPAPQRFVRFYSCPDYVVEQVNTHLLILAPFLLRCGGSQNNDQWPCLVFPPSTYGPCCCRRVVTKNSPTFAQSKNDLLTAYCTFCRCWWRNACLKFY